MNRKDWQKKCKRQALQTEMNPVWFEALPNKMLQYVYHFCPRGRSGWTSNLQKKMSSSGIQTIEHLNNGPVRCYLGYSVGLRFGNELLQLHGQILRSEVRNDINTPCQGNLQHFLRESEHSFIADSCVVHRIRLKLRGFLHH